jgi:BirA family transcriptional regulator, biotin operon repressor / biotin---[acetyl-CoA-carboxylase] ligase
VELPRTEDQTPSLRIRETAGSTNDVLADLVSSGNEPAWSTVLTLDQTGGRGRLGRVWTAPKDKTVALSVLVKIGDPAAVSPGWIPLLAGAAMSTSIDALVGRGRTGLKWPNDVQIDGLKVCGILAEFVPTVDAIIVGTGVNLTLEESELPVSTATSLALAGVASRGDELVDLVVSRYLSTLQELLQRLESARGDALESGIHRVVSEWCRTLGREVRVSLPDGAERFGLATGIDATGRLLVRLSTSGETFAVAAGDVTHLRYE